MSSRVDVATTCVNVAENGHERKLHVPLIPEVSER